MPQITIRTSPEIYIPAGTSNLNPYYKEFVNQLLSIAPDLTVVKVESDTSSSYAVSLRFMGQTEVGFHLTCSSQNLTVSVGYWNKEGIFRTITSNYMAMFAAGKRFKVSSYGVDGTLVYVMPYSELSPSSTGFVFGMFTSTGLESPQFCADLLTVSYTYPEPAVVPFLNRLPVYTIAPTKDKSEAISLLVYTNKAFVSAGYKYALLPAAYGGYTSNMGFLNIKWGGKYNLYNLYDADGIVRTRPGDIVNINGVEILSPGYVAVIE